MFRARSYLKILEKASSVLAVRGGEIQVFSGTSTETESSGDKQARERESAILRAVRLELDRVRDTGRFASGGRVVRGSE